MKPLLISAALLVLTGTAQAQDALAMKVYNNYDFTPGDKVLADVLAAIGHTYQLHVGNPGQRLDQRSLPVVDMPRRAYDDRFHPAGNHTRESAGGRQRPF